MPEEARRVQQPESSLSHWREARRRTLRLGSRASSQRRGCRRRPRGLEAPPGVGGPECRRHSRRRGHRAGSARRHVPWSRRGHRRSPRPRRPRCREKLWRRPPRALGQFVWHRRPQGARRRLRPRRRRRSRDAPRCRGFGSQKPRRSQAAAQKRGPRLRTSRGPEPAPRWKPYSCHVSDCQLLDTTRAVPRASPGACLVGRAPALKATCIACLSRAMERRPTRRSTD